MHSLVCSASWGQPVAVRTKGHVFRNQLLPTCASARKWNVRPGRQFRTTSLHGQGTAVVAVLNGQSFAARHSNDYRAKLRRLRCDHRNGVGSTSQDSGSSALTPQNGSQSAALLGLEEGAVPLDVERLRALCGVEEIPEEVEPLADCLKRASAKVEEATSMREALEAEAQEVAQLAVQAREMARKAKSRLDEAEAEVEATDIVIEKLQQTVGQLQAQVDQDVEVKSGSVPKLPEGHAGAKGAALLLTREMGENGEEDGGNGAPGAREEEPTPAAMLQVKQLQLLEVQDKRLEATSKVEELRKRLQIVELAAGQSEQVAAAAMSAAEAAVRDEMEASAVVKEAQTALLKALQEISVLEGTDRKAKADEEQRAKQKAAAEAKDIKAEAPPAPKVLASQSSSTARKDDTKPKPAKQDERKAMRLVSYQEPKDTTNPLLTFVRKYRLVVTAVAAVGLTYVFLRTTGSGQALLAQASSATARIADAVASVTSQMPWPEIPHSVEGYLVTIWLLLTACVAVPLVCQLPGGSAVLGFLAGGAVLGPHALGIIKDVEHVRHIAELGVVFLLFNIGLELSLDRLQQMQKFVFGMGSAQVLTTLAFVAYFVHSVLGMSVPASIVLGGGLALSSTAVAMQVLQDRGESGSRHGRATFSILLFQDLAVVVLLMLVPLLAPSDSGSAGFGKIAEAIGIAGVKAIACIVGITIGGRVLLRPLYRAISNVGNQEIFAATTLLVVLGTSVMTQIAGLSLALGAFLAGLLLAETEYHLQVESDIAPYKGLLMGLFFMTVGMEISVGLFFARWKTVLAGISMLIIGKTAVVAGVGSAFGLSVTQATRAGLLLAPGGEFAFVLLGEALSHNLMTNETVREVFLVVALSMALTPYLAEFGQRIGRMFEKNDVKALQPDNAVVDELRNHVIIAGFGRVGQLIAQLLSERLIPFVALDVSSDRVQAGKGLDLPVYFGDAGSAAVLHSIGAHRASCAVITLDTPGANYRTVWALNKNFPQVKTFVRAHDVDHGVVLEKAGATAVVPETLEPSLQLAAAVLSEYSMPEEEVANAIRTFRKSHLKELQLLAVKTRSSLGYGFATRDEDSEDEEDQVFDGQRAVAEPVG